ncbi:bifunctional glycosyltransferase/CDP-glycerol:glycerophosphate glycerophosphotransferase [Rubneribacter sp.]
MDRQPLASVVVPVYNKSDSLERCVESVACQMEDVSRIEVVLVNDGSTDDSLTICRSLEMRYSFVKVLNQSNQGVSAARNTALRYATGKYILFLDADDYLENGSLKALIDFFDSYQSEIDVVAYDISYFDSLTGTQHGHGRNRWLKRSGVYDLAFCPYVAQTTMNICIKNNQQGNVLFDQSLKMGEDQLFITTLLAKKAKIGFCKEATYVYVKDGSNTSKIGNNPLYAYCDMLRLFSSLLSLAEQNSRMASYAYQMLLYNLDWRIRGNCLFPIHYRGDKRIQEEKQLDRMLERIPSLEICSSPYLNEYHKGYFLSRLKRAEKGILPVYSINGASLALKDGTFWKATPPKIIISRCYCDNGTVELRGRIVCPVFIFDVEPKLVISSETAVRCIPVSESSFDYVLARHKTAQSYTYETLLDLDDQRSSSTFSFSIDLGTRQVFFPLIELSPKRHNGCRIENTILFDNYKIEVKGAKVIASILRKREKRAVLCDFWRRDRRQFEKRVALRLFAACHRNRRIWVYSDLPSSPAEGNALLQILHDLKENDGVDRYYVSNYETELISKYPILSGRVLRCESNKHVYCALNAEVVLASYLESFTFRPVSQTTFDNLGDLVKCRHYIYLQHGILHAHMPWYCSYDRILFDKEVVSTQFEIDNLTKNYLFPLSALIPSGAPRLDKLLKSPVRKTKHKVLYAPSWRGYLVSGKASKREALTGSFASSSFYIGLKDFVNGLHDEGVLEESGYSLDIKMHPNFECYENLLDFCYPEVNIVHGDIEESDYAIMVTDFSSYVYDFVYSGSKILYYVPDQQEFDAGVNQYSELDLPFDNGFGPHCTSAAEAIVELRRLIALDLAGRDDPKYVKRKEGFFLHSDGMNADRLYKEVKKLTLSSQ